MTTKQSRIGSGFGMRSTAADVLDGIDLTGRVALVTGGYSGIGLETTRALAGAGARVVVPARRPELSQEALSAIPGAETAALDLADLDSVRAFADSFPYDRIDLMINSAGIMASPHTVVGPGWEAQFAVNHLGHFALVNRLWDRLNDGARVVSVSSAAHHASGIRWDDPWFERGYDRWLAYGQAKTANALFAVHLDRLGGARGVRAFSLHPGAILTPLQRHMTTQEQVDRGWIDEQGNIIDSVFKSPEQGAATQVWAATSPQLADLGGVYCENCDIAEAPESADPEQGAAGVAAHARDPEQAERLWAWSAELTGVDAFARS
ncbi:SDR family NAD(P)-dependent oxidoreductase [Nocardiopsis sp. B62]|uniref:SDR family NAD(P)-dependent oxidoreductase n=1 Tax=Nocardiopsis sp. B62 TaxID=2824874 RepID=UPI001B3585F0|nr:SDR family NAD(P)-dependent oxidoreductase [Nocardiopsis sp. B62]MBQ1080641.1 SDR family NAD(P)-dependent oxidoreductase [Nocardiopsis sp. B62]